MKRLLIVVACLLAAACTTTRPTTALPETGPAPDAAILVVRPDIELSVLNAAGLSEPRADWSAEAVTHVQAALERSVAISSHTVRTLDPGDATDGLDRQLLRLHQAVGESILIFENGQLPLPTHEDGFSWTLGDGARRLGERYGADYALFTFGRGEYASSGRVATFVVMSALGVGAPLGHQRVFTSLVDLRTGQVIWFNVGVAGPGADMRDPGGARSLVDSLMGSAPL